MSANYGNFLGSLICVEHRAWNMSALEAGSIDPQQLLLLEVAYAAFDGSMLNNSAANC